MARIRTIKPEFFTSPDTAQVEPRVRLLYIAMWCWADDFGVGETNLNGLLGLAFPDSDEVSAPDLRRFCADIARAFSVEFYTVRGRHYYAIPSWTEHQKTERRAGRRKHPAPDDPESAPDKRIYDLLEAGADSAPEVRRKTGAKSAPIPAGTGEQGNRGTGDSAKAGELSPPAELSTKNAGTLVAEWINHCDQRPPNRTVGQVSKELKALLDEGFAYEQVRRGLAKWASKSYAPSSLPTFVNEQANGKTRAWADADTDERDKSWQPVPVPDFEYDLDGNITRGPQ